VRHSLIKHADATSPRLIFSKKGFDMRGGVILEVESCLKILWIEVSLNVLFMAGSPVSYIEKCLSVIAPKTCSAGGSRANTRNTGLSSDGAPPRSRGTSDVPVSGYVRWAKHRSLDDLDGRNMLEGYLKRTATPGQSRTTRGPGRCLISRKKWRHCCPVRRTRTSTSSTTPDSPSSRIASTRQKQCR
jgi:hypothetical protein